MIEVAFLGSLARDCESKVSKNGRPYLRFSCRVGTDDAAQWISVTCFDPAAIEQPAKFTKGATIFVEGTGLKIDEWRAQDGTTRQALSCVSWHARLPAIGRNRPPRDAGRERKPVAERAAAAFYDDTIPFAPEWRG
jgi:single-stranded DNA-binding protein